MGLLATGGLIVGGLAATAVGMDNWSESMTYAQVVLGEETDFGSRFGTFISEQGTAFDIITNPNNGAPLSPIERPLQNAEVAAAVLVTGVGGIAVGGSKLLGKK